MAKSGLAARACEPHWRRYRSLGRRGERAAEPLLRRKGYKIVARGERGPLGELDLVAVDGRTVVFVEVKTRRSHDAGHPAEAVGPEKQQRLTRLALAYLKRHDLLECTVAIRRGGHHLARRCAKASDRALPKRLRSRRPRPDVQLELFNRLEKGSPFSPRTTKMGSPR